MSFITGYHHLTLSTHGAQEDYDFYTKTLGLHSIKRTVLFDGTIPVYHLYYGAKNGDPSTIVTTFPFKKPGIYGKRGTNQSKIIQLSIPIGSAEFWIDRLNERGIPAAKTSRFGITRVALAHPCGIDHELVESPVDTRPPITSEVNGVGANHGIRGIYGAAVAVFDRTSMDDFLTVGMGMKKEADSDEGLMFSVLNDGGPSGMVEVLHQQTGPQGTWTLSGGTIHHLALDTGSEERQLNLKAHLEGLGFTDVSDQKDRNYFKSCYVRSPGGALFEIAWSVEGCWAKDEPADAIGSTLVFPSWLEDRREEMIAGLEQASF